MPKIDFRQVGDPLDAEMLKAIFDEIALVLGGLVAVHLPTIDPEMDDFLWGLCRNLDVIRGRALKKLDPRPHRSRPNLKPHPAITELRAHRKQF